MYRFPDVVFVFDELDVNSHCVLSGLFMVPCVNVMSAVCEFFSVKYKQQTSMCILIYAQS